MRREICDCLCVIRICYHVDGTIISHSTPKHLYHSTAHQEQRTLANNKSNRNQNRFCLTGFMVSLDFLQQFSLILCCFLFCLACTTAIPM